MEVDDQGAGKTERGRENDRPRRAEEPVSWDEEGAGEYGRAHDRSEQRSLNQVMARYPNTAVAKSAELRLERIAKEGN